MPIFIIVTKTILSGELVVVAPVAAGAFKHGLRAVSILIGSDMPETY